MIRGAWPSLESLSICQTLLSEAEIRQLLATQWAPQLKGLYLGHSWLSDLGVTELCRAAWDSLEVLVLAHSNITANGVEELAMSRNLSHVSFAFLGEQVPPDRIRDALGKRCLLAW